jgi:hypothetical protein
MECENHGGEAMLLKCQTEGCGKLLRETDIQECDCGMKLCRPCFASDAHTDCELPDTVIEDEANATGRVDAR